MNRRDLLKNALLAAAQAAVVPTYLLAVEDAEEKYYSAFRERCPKNSCSGNGRDGHLIL